MVVSERTSVNELFQLTGSNTISQLSDVLFSRMKAGGAEHYKSAEAIRVALYRAKDNLSRLPTPLLELLKNFDSVPSPACITHSATTLTSVLESNDLNFDTVVIRAAVESIQIIEATFDSLFRESAGKAECIIYLSLANQIAIPYINELYHFATADGHSRIKNIQCEISDEIKSLQYVALVDSITGDNVVFQIFAENSQLNCFTWPVALSHRWMMLDLPVIKKGAKPHCDVNTDSLYIMNSDQKA
ncbi:MAG: hypothetical protein KF836_01445 [Fimbriimonadaceae bacterium]|nr:hypothetical protein [Fimbriimonadaceae bacterium]